MSTPHNQAEKGDIARVVLMPGDPLRAKFIADTFLENPICFTTVRNVLGYTGEWNGARISVMASGMGMPSIGIYSYELFKFYDVDCIIRVGSAGGYTDNLHVYDIVVAEKSWSESTFAKVQCNYQDEYAYPSKELNEIILNEAKELGIKVYPSTLHSSDVFYHEDGWNEDEVLAKGCEAVEMESFALFSNAKVLGKQAATIVTISDSFVYKENLSAKEREENFQQMMKLALASAKAYLERNPKN